MDQQNDIKQNNNNCHILEQLLFMSLLYVEQNDPVIESMICVIYLRLGKAHIF